MYVNQSLTLTSPVHSMDFKFKGAGHHFIILFLFDTLCVLLSLFLKERDMTLCHHCQGKSSLSSPYLNK